eukprot:759317-Hanusia_phi.AAC.1
MCQPRARPQTQQALGVSQPVIAVYDDDDIIVVRIGHGDCFMHISAGLQCCVSSQSHHGLCCTKLLSSPR